MCTFEQLAIITSYTPRLTYLKFMHPDTSKPDMKMIILPITLSYLTHFSIRLFEINFDDFERFISKIECQLKCLSLRTSYDDIAYLDDKRWENFILNIHNLLITKLIFQYVMQNHIDLIQHFWIERKWIYEIIIEEEDIFYSIHPYKYTTKKIFY